jgi:hypothetical protein
MEVPYTDHHYIDDSVLLDGLYEFHPDYFATLTPEEWHNLQTYYLTGLDDIPNDVLVYRREHLVNDPQLEPRARRVVEKLQRLSGMATD